MQSPIDKFHLPINPRELQRHKAIKLVGIYFLFHGDVIVYVGQSKDILARMSVHMNDDGKDFDTFSFFECDPADLDLIEGDYIVALQPRLNTTIPRQSRWKSKNQIKSLACVGGWDINRWIKDNNIEEINGYYDVSDFVGMGVIS